MTTGTVQLPAAKDVRDMLTGLVGKPVAVNPGAPVTPTPDSPVAVASKHLCPATLAEELEKMRAAPEVYITHLKPGEGALTMREVSQAAGRWRPRMLENNQVFSL